MLKDSAQAEREQEADCARIEATVRLAETAIAALAGSDEAHKRQCELRDRTILTVADVRRNIIQRAEQAKEAPKELIETFFQQNAPSQSTDDYSAMLHVIPTSALVDHLQYLIRQLARVQGVCHAFEKRADRHRYIAAFDEILGQCALADSGDGLAQRLARICPLADETDAKLTALWFGHINPEPETTIRCRVRLWLPFREDRYDFEHSRGERGHHPYEQHNQGSNDRA
jgi:hypothetical protein